MIKNFRLNEGYNSYEEYIDYVEELIGGVYKDKRTGETYLILSVNEELSTFKNIFYNFVNIKIVSGYKKMLFYDDIVEICKNNENTVNFDSSSLLSKIEDITFNGECSYLQLPEQISLFSMSEEEFSGSNENIDIEEFEEELKKLNYEFVMIQIDQNDIDSIKEEIKKRFKL